jgi:membrane-associated phospholipid phosphatase
MASNASNASNSGSSSGAGSAANSTSVSDGWFFADRIDLPFVTEVTSAGVPIATERLSPPVFPDRNWSADWFAWRVLVDFVQTKWTTVITLLDWTKMPNFTSVADEIDNLVTAAQDERADALDEILSQAEEFTSYFLNLMTAKPTSYPATTRVLNAACLVGLFVAMNWKAQFNRPRASQLCPALLPPIAVPDHASYPSGHSTQAHLMALCMGQVFALLPPAQQPLMQPMQADLWVLADRIARNREIAGLHYPSDTAAGIVLANQILPLLSGMAATSAYQTAIANAVTEWTWP